MVRWLRGSRGGKKYSDQHIKLTEKSLRSVGGFREVLDFIADGKDTALFRRLVPHKKLAEVEIFLVKRKYNEP